MLYAARHPGHPGALVLQSTFARFDLDRIVEEFRRAGGDEVAGVIERAYGGDSASVTPKVGSLLGAFGPWVAGEREEARTVENEELNAPGLELMRRFDVLDQLARIDARRSFASASSTRSRRWPPPGRSSRPCRGDRAARGDRGSRPLPLEGRPGPLLAAGHRVRRRALVFRARAEGGELAVDYFIKFDGIKGESADAKHKDEIDVESWSWGESNVGGAGPRRRCGRGQGLDAGLPLHDAHEQGERLRS